MQLGELDLREDYSEPYRQLLMKFRDGSRWYGPVVSKAGGWLDTQQEPSFTQCPCGWPLQHVATIRTLNGTTFVVGDMGALYLTTCADPTCDAGRLIWWLDHT